MTDPKKIRCITRIEERLLAAHDTLSAIVDDEPALAEITVDAFDCADPDRVRPIDPEIRAARATVGWALKATRSTLAKLGALEKR